MRESPGGFTKRLFFSDFIILGRNELLFVHVISHVTKRKGRMHWGTSQGQQIVIVIFNITMAA